MIFITSKCQKKNRCPLVSVGKGRDKKNGDGTMSHRRSVLACFVESYVFIPPILGAFCFLYKSVLERFMLLPIFFKLLSTYRQFFEPVFCIL